MDALASQLDGVGTAPDPKAGAAGSVYDLVPSPWRNHRVKVVAGVLADEVQALLQTYFAALRPPGREG